MQRGTENPSILFTLKNIVVAHAEKTFRPLPSTGRVLTIEPSREDLPPGTPVPLVAALHVGINGDRRIYRYKITDNQVGGIPHSLGLEQVYELRRRAARRSQ